MAAVVKGLFLLHSVFFLYVFTMGGQEEGRGWLSTNLKVVRSSTLHVKLSLGKILNPQLPPLECERQMLGSKCLGIEKKMLFHERKVKLCVTISTRSYTFKKCRGKMKSIQRQEGITTTVRQQGFNSLLVVFTFGEWAVVMGCTLLCIHSHIHLCSTFHTIQTTSLQFVKKIRSLSRTCRL